MTFWKRLFSTIVLLALFACIVFGNQLVSRISFGIIAGFLSFFVPYEACKMLEHAGRKVYAKLTSGLICFLFLAVFFTFLSVSPFAVVSLLILLFSACFFIPWFLLLFSGNRQEVLEKMMNGCGIIGLFLIPFLLLEITYFADVKLFLFLILGTKIGDIGAYVFGTISNKLLKNGNHKMVPKISPGKSWEGAAGGLLVSILFSVFTWQYLIPMDEPEYSVVLPVITGVILFVFGAAGDLAESCFKRICGAKDSGKTLPGIGGVFDLVDSLLMNAIVFTMFRMIFL